MEEVYYSLTSIALDIIGSRKKIYQSDLDDLLNVESRDSSRVAMGLEKRGVIKRTEVVYNGRWTFLLEYKQHEAYKHKPSDIKKIATMPCTRCKYEKMCVPQSNHSIEPLICPALAEWVVNEYTRFKTSPEDFKDTEPLEIGPALPMPEKLIARPKHKPSENKPETQQTKVESEIEITGMPPKHVEIDSKLMDRVQHLRGLDADGLAAELGIPYVIIIDARLLLKALRCYGQVVDALAGSQSDIDKKVLSRYERLLMRYELIPAVLTRKS